MTVGIHTDLDGKFCNWIRRFEIVLNENNINTIRLDINQEDFWEQVKNLDYFIFRFQNIDSHHQVARTILPIIENQLKIKIFPNHNTWWHFDDKIKETFLLQSSGFPVVRSRVFYTKSEALNWLSTVKLPFIFKLKEGAGSRDVILVESKRQAKRIINKMFWKGMKSANIKHGKKAKQKYNSLKQSLKTIVKQILGYLNKNYDPRFWQIQKNYVYFQRFIPNNDFDTRVTIIGKRAFAFRRYNRKNDFRSSGSGLIDYDQTKINKECIKLAFEITKHFEFQVMTYDFLFDESNNPQICEMGYTFLDEAVYNVPGFYNTDLSFYDGNYWPQVCILQDLLGVEDIIIPQKEKMNFNILL